MSAQPFTVLCTCPPMLKSLPPAPAGMEWLLPPEFAQQCPQSVLETLAPKADCWVAGDEPVGRELLEKASGKDGKGGKLKSLIRWGVGIDNVDQAACKDFGIWFSNTPGVFGDEVADVAIGYSVICLRGLVQIHEAGRKGDWIKPPGRSLKACTAAVVGFGCIGRAVGVRLKACGMKILPVDPYYKPKEAGDEPAYELDDAISKADLIVLCCAATPDNYHLFNEDRLLSKCKAGVHIVNVARGSLIQESALLKGLESGHVASACLDVLENEPISLDNPLREHPKVVFGSHNGSNSVDAVARVNAQVVEMAMGRKAVDFGSV